MSIHLSIYLSLSIYTYTHTYIDIYIYMCIYTPQVPGGRAEPSPGGWSATLLP